MWTIAVIVSLRWVTQNQKKITSQLNKRTKWNDDDEFYWQQVLSEDKLDFVQKKFEKSCFSLYSIELASKSNVKRLNVAKPNECKW